MSRSLHDDSDMKIANFERSSQRSRDSRDELEYLRNKENGNLARAHEMGTRLAALAIAYEKPVTWKLFTETENNALSSQKRVLMSFALSVGLKAYLQNSYATDTALNVFYEQLREIAPDFYEDIHDTGDYSFYYLAYRRGGDLNHNIGSAFAMLCGQEDNSAYIELGSTLFCRFYNEVKKLVDRFSFESAGFIDD